MLNGILDVQEGEEIYVPMDDEKHTNVQWRIKYRK